MCITSWRAVLARMDPVNLCTGKDGTGLANLGGACGGANMEMHMDGAYA